MIVIAEMVENLARPCEGCGKGLPALASRARCLECEQAESDRLDAEWMAPTPGELAAAAIRSERADDVLRYLELDPWD